MTFPFGDLSRPAFFGGNIDLCWLKYFQVREPSHEFQEIFLLGAQGTALGFIRGGFSS